MNEPASVYSWWPSWLFDPVPANNIPLVGRYAPNHNDVMPQQTIGEFTIVAIAAFGVAAACGKVFDENCLRFM